MKIKIINGNLLDSTADVILHQVNCQGKMNSGVAKAIREKWPEVFIKYSEFCSSGNAKLGKCLPVKISDKRVVVNMFSQENYGYDKKLYTSYDAVNTCLANLKNYMVINGFKSLSLPYNMCCCRGGGDWDVIMALLNANFRNSNDISIEIYRLDNG